MMVGSNFGFLRCPSDLVLMMNDDGAGPAVSDPCDRTCLHDRTFHYRHLGKCAHH